MSALDYEGLEFKNAETGELAERPKMHVQYDQIPEMLSESTETVLEIPPKDGASQPYTVSHTFHIPQPPPSTGQTSLSFEDQARMA